MNAKTIYNGIVQAVDIFDERHKNWIPYAYALLGSLFLASSSLLVKYNKEYPAFELIYWRSILVLVVNTQLMKITGDTAYTPTNTPTLKFLILRSFFSALSAIMLFSATHMINLGEATILFQTSPIWSNFIACLFFSEPFCFRTFVYTCFSFVGIIVLLQPPFIFGDVDQAYDLTVFLGQIISISGAIAFAIMSNINKFLKDKVTKPTLIQYIHMGSLGVSSFVKTQQAYSSLDFYTLSNFGVIVIFSLLTYGAQIFLNQALFMKGANKIMPFNYSQAVFALIFDYFLFHKTIGFLQLLAGCLIIFCCFKIASKS